MLLTEPLQIALLYIAHSQPWVHELVPATLQALRRQDLVEQWSPRGQLLDRLRLSAAGVEAVATMPLSLDLRKALVALWLSHEPGTNIIVREPDGRDVATTTRSNAALLCNHTPVIWLVGIPCCSRLTSVRLDVRIAQAAEAA